MLVTILAGAVASATPILLATLGELIAERSGVLNLGVEGTMLLGAMAAFAATLATGSLTTGVLIGAIVGSALALIHAILTVTFRANQVVTGLALTLFGAGLSEFMGKPLTMVVVPATMNPIAVPWASEIPLLGRVLFVQPVLVYISYVLVLLFWLFLERTHAGLSLKAVGEDPATADVLGIRVAPMRYSAVIVGGLLAGLAGSYLSLAYLRSWTEGLTAGRGWIAVALVIFSGWHPVRALIGAYLFGLAYVLGFQAQIAGPIGRYLSIYIIQMLPYVLAIAVLLGAGRRGRFQQAPAALTVPYVREHR
jgi:simple sugar transport system permease protein